MFTNIFPHTRKSSLIFSPKKKNFHGGEYLDISVGIFKILFKPLEYKQYKSAEVKIG